MHMKWQTHNLCPRSSSNGVWEKRLLVGVSVSEWYSELQAVSVSARAVASESCKGLRLRVVANVQRYIFS